MKKTSNKRKASGRDTISLAVKQYICKSAEHQVTHLMNLRRNDFEREVRFLNERVDRLTQRLNGAEAPKRENQSPSNEMTVQALINILTSHVECGLMSARAEVHIGEQCPGEGLPLRSVEIVHGKNRILLTDQR